MAGIQVVWFKRDLRVADHLPLLHSLQSGPTVPLYVIETDYWRQPDMSLRHWLFVRDCLKDLDRQLHAKGSGLIVRTGDVCDVLSMLHKRHGVAGLWSHEETGNDWTFQRDRRVASWCRQHGIVWREIPQHAVVRRLANRDHWGRHWQQRMTMPPAAEPANIPAVLEEPLSLPSVLGLDLRPCPLRQPGGRQQALRLLQGFLHHRGRFYRGNMSSPVSAENSCSRLSPHLAWGTVSVREVLNGLWLRQQQQLESGWRKSLRSFESRLHWHCHFIQKLEDQPEIEFSNMHPGFDDLRPAQVDPVYFAAWAEGQTGFPFIDACMRSLHATGWLNFRMRAMLMAFSSYHLWLPWRQPSLHLARLFTDYEPGIHYSQVQMQSGTTGINALRIYNPVKQSQDQDPEGIFIRRWVPELAALPTAWLHEPWRMPEALQRRFGVVLGQDYPLPIVDHQAAGHAARAKISEHRRRHGVAEASQQVLSRHGSRRRGSRPRSAAGQKNHPDQLDLGL
ncbi:deoxyribodipyrimidine photo-lyase [Alcanivorax sp. 1008]|uniref:FAD-binding domain-containing protein n=1 Tax=Alcanivorax sp. 1008 TaxID=2816853 RepID=UPI001E2EDA09|nr:deoxyribodipyrimidine photo-lyase [Alcanivorax sp. 1008]